MHLVVVGACQAKGGDADVCFMWLTHEDRRFNEEPKELVLRDYDAVRGAAGADEKQLQHLCFSASPAPPDDATRGTMCSRHRQQSTGELRQE